MTAEDVIGVDVGGGGIRVRTSAGTSTRLALDRGPVPRHGGMIDVAELSDRIVSLANQTLVGDGPVGRIAVGLTGMPGLLDEPRALARRIQHAMGASAVVVASDALTTHLGALGGQAGIVVSAGTGLIALGTDLETAWNRVDGWGYLLGDEGSGAWIGIRGINAALRALDERPGASVILLELVRDRFGNVHDVPAAIYNSEAPAVEAATFAPMVAEAARRGDVVAQSIWTMAGTYIAQSAVAAARGLPHRFSWGGKLFSVGELLLEPFRIELVRTLPDAQIISPHGQAVDGALRLALSPDISRAEGNGAYLQEYIPAL